MSALASEARLTAGERTRAAILERAVDLASVEGLEGLSIGRLATELDMSKSGLFAHFGSKEELQLAVVEAARMRVVTAMFLPSLAAPRGLERLMALCCSWLRYAEAGVFPGGCFFAAASMEFDGRPGPVQHAISRAMADWLTSLSVGIRKAQEVGHIDASVDPEQLAFELNAFFLAANWSFQLQLNRDAFERASTAIEHRLREVRTKRAPQVRSLRP